MFDKVSIDDVELVKPEISFGFQLVNDITTHHIECSVPGLSSTMPVSKLQRNSQLKNIIHTAFLSRHKQLARTWYCIMKAITRQKKQHLQHLSANETSTSQFQRPARPLLLLWFYVSLIHILEVLKVFSELDCGFLLRGNNIKTTLTFILHFIFFFLFFHSYLLVFDFSCSNFFCVFKNSFFLPLHSLHEDFFNPWKR